MLRRRFLQSLAATAGAASLSAGEPAGVKLGFDTYSLRAFRWKAPQLIEYAASQKLDTIQISSLGDYESLDPAYLAKVKDQAARAGIVLEGGTGCICPSSHAFNKNGPPARERVLEGLRVAKAIGATSMRCYLGGSADRLGTVPIEAHIENTVQVFRSVRTEALDLGVRIAIENHDGDMQAREVKTLIEAAGKDFVGSCLDTGNPLWVVEDPLVSLEVLAPYVVTTHVRDSVLFEHPRGAAGQWVVLGDGNVDSPDSRSSFGWRAPAWPCNWRSSPGARRACCRIWRRISGRPSPMRAPANSRASWRWPRAAIRIWGRW
jgi:sugar phosphate isomerase/epimerase